VRIVLGLAWGQGPAPDDIIALDIAGAPRVKAPTRETGRQGGTARPAK
jgi:hypothetical protein